MTDRAAGALHPAELRQRLGDVFNEAQSSSNAIIRARAVALYADATVLVSGGGPGSLGADLRSMRRTCSSGTGS